MSDFYNQKDETYYQSYNTVLVNLIPEQAKRIVDIGCSSGRLGEVLKERNGAYVTGIEAFKEAATQAKKVLDRVYFGNIEEEEWPYPDETFDVVVFGDVLEHLVDPWDVLRKVHPYLDEGGVVCASIPNINHVSIIEELLRGNFTYAEMGLMDQTHMRFFTVNEIHKMFVENGFEFEAFQYIPLVQGNQVQLLERLKTVGSEFGIDTTTLVERGSAYQYVMRARKI
ncbi:methyltransferase domain-containing protein [Geomicrobium sediminis]|uniref:2-polyprenyl-3-methyl-5-hydroxy-6-metoxy-1, 4-benzoquinol methylase n=1 Tax=Geomicrobium sediminis TaxID=1347788 RepID=A0ABS2PHY0_9BACL|nr:2-polyprenyl-3-methyl-5-hydroxy-6-metoxy-1,4-benzoquinol methylase [Geomicrobium sediminis]